MLGEFTDWAQDIRNDLTELQSDIELERFQGSVEDVTKDIYTELTGIVRDAVRMVSVATLHDETLEDELNRGGVGNTLARRIEGIVRDLEFDDPDNVILDDLIVALTDYHKGTDLPDLIVVPRIAS